jgi:ubiquinone/menaquinone biosynthesis C-methylase UbiE
LVEARPDQWSRWILERRDAGSMSQREATLARLNVIRDRVLANARPLEGVALLDVGTGDGLIGLAALEAVGDGGRVIFADVSDALLERCRETVTALGLTDRARFVTTRAEELAGISDGSIDVATMRSVLIYVTDKPSAFGSLHRVLRPGGRISIFEPINRLMSPEPAGRLWGYDLTPVADLVAKVRAMFTGSEDPRFRAAMMGFDDRDLARLAEQAGFDRIHVECHIDVSIGPTDPPVSLDAFLDRAPNPNAPTTREALVAALTQSEQDQFLTALDRALTEHDAISRMAVAYLSARKPAD